MEKVVIIQEEKEEEKKEKKKKRKRRRRRRRISFCKLCYLRDKVSLHELIIGAGEIVDEFVCYHRHISWIGHLVE